MSYIGQFLIATPSMGDPRFAETVVLITEHQDSGAWGFVVNKQLDTTISQLVSVSDMSQKDVCQFIYWGGPVDQFSGFILHDGKKQWHTTTKISDDMSISFSMEMLEDIARGKGPDKYLVLLGYCGWDKDQLEDEIAADAWITVPADPSIVFDTPIEKRYEAALKLVGLDLNSLISFSESGGYA